MLRFENLDVWKRGSALCVEMYRYFYGHKDFGFRDQITRSALSVPSNIAEGFERFSTKERARFWSYAKGSVGELRTQIYIGQEIGYIAEEKAGRWLSESEQLSKMLASMIKGIQHTETRG
ncbi:four helix bundle protein [Alcanivorax sp.]|uniref:four helix bundle protein n=1 Tax=Alcanivorax sp. TaxID=1872427 RepID=UPI0025C44E98|nr:four helix bundle protein [Alcanivorax sp.]